MMAGGNGWGAREGEAKEFLTGCVLCRDVEAGSVEINSGASPIREFCAEMGSGLERMKKILGEG
jgi:hypothetical protein